MTIWKYAILLIFYKIYNECAMKMLWLDITQSIYIFEVLHVINQKWFLKQISH